MKRDMDLVRAILIKVEDMPAQAGSFYIYGWEEEFFQLEGFGRDAIIEHFKLLLDEGFIRGFGQQGINHFSFSGLSWQGHELIDTIRNPDVWTRTRSGMKTVGGFGLDVMLQLAKAEGKRLITEKLGIPM